MEDVSTSLKALFIIITLFTVLQFYRATNRARIFQATMAGWMLLQWLITRTGFYQDTTSLPPRAALLVAPPLIAILLLFLTKAGRSFLDTLDTNKLTLLHTIRIPVEMVLYYLFAAGTIPEIMTFEGLNFDILSGVSAPIIYYFAFVRKALSNTALLAWNIICLGLLLNIVVIALLSVDTPFQQFGQEQPNIAVSFFPFSWLAAVVVPLVLLSHLVVIRKLTTGK
jgi:hypothetical protein